MSIESARKATNGTHLEVRICNPQFDENEGSSFRPQIPPKGLADIGLVADPADIRVGQMPDLGKRTRHQAVAIAKVTGKVAPWLHATLGGAPEGIIQFHELPGSGSIGDAARGDLMAGFTKAPFYGAAYEKRGIAKGVVLLFRAATQPWVEYVSSLLQGIVAGVAKDVTNSNQHEIGKINTQLAAMSDNEETAVLRALKEKKIDKGFAINRVLMHPSEYFTSNAEQTRIFDVCGAMVELTGILPRGATQGEIINIVRSYGREMHVLTILQRGGEVELLTLVQLRTVWARLKGMGVATFDRLATKLFTEPPTSVEYSDSSKKKATAFGVKMNDMLPFAPEWEYDGQDGMAVAKDYQCIPTEGWTVAQQVKYLVVLKRVALEDGIHLRTSNTGGELHVAPINFSPEDDAWDITHTFLKADRESGLTADISKLTPVQVPETSTDPVDAGLKRAAADGELARSFRSWAHTFVTKAAALA